MPKLLPALRKALVPLADAARAKQMQAYMKSELPYHGVAMPVLRRLTREQFAGLSWPDAAAWERDVRELWDGAKFREERYAAITLCRHREARAFQVPEAMPLYERLIVTGAWWDLVDEVATHCVGDLLRKYPEPLKKMMRAWSRSPDLWKRRTSIICQNRLREETDLQLLFDCIEPSIASKEFFLRKAIGWALREYAEVDQEAVVRYVDANAEELSGSSKREALKYVG